jgi:hypothetical protein
VTFISDAVAFENVGELLDFLGDDIRVLPDDSLSVAIGSDYRAALVVAVSVSIWATMDGSSGRPYAVEAGGNFEGALTEEQSSLPIGSLSLEMRYAHSCCVVAWLLRMLLGSLVVDGDSSCLLDGSNAIDKAQCNGAIRASAAPSRSG